MLWKMLRGLAVVEGYSRELCLEHAQVTGMYNHSIEFF